MMKQLLVMLMLLCSTAIFAQDVIVKKDGSTILAKVLEVNTDNIRYKKHSNPNGPTYTIGKSEIMSINYENGEKEFFKEESIPSQSKEIEYKSTDPKYIQRNPSEDNNRLIEMYDKRYQIGKKYKPSKKSVTSCLTTWGIAPSSMISNEDIEIEFERKFDAHNCQLFQYAVVIKNRSNHTIYIDRGNSYRVSRDENFCYYSGAQVSTSRSSGGGMAVGLGSIANVAGIGGALGTIAQGISVGGGASRSSGMTVNQQRFLVLPPHGRAALATNNEIKGQKLDSYERYIFLKDDINPIIHKGEVLNYDENNTPYSIDYLITYSDNHNFTTYSVLNTKLYIKQIFGTRFTMNSSGWSGSWDEAFERRIQDIDQYCIIGYMGGEYFVNYMLKH